MRKRFTLPLAAVLGAGFFYYPGSALDWIHTAITVPITLLFIGANITFVAMLLWTLVKPTYEHVMDIYHLFVYPQLVGVSDDGLYVPGRLPTLNRPNNDEVQEEN